MQYSWAAQTSGSGEGDAPQAQAAALAEVPSVVAQAQQVGPSVLATHGSLAHIQEGALATRVPERPGMVVQNAVAVSATVQMVASM